MVIPRSHRYILLCRKPPPLRHAFARAGFRPNCPAFQHTPSSLTLTPLHHLTINVIKPTHHLHKYHIHTHTCTRDARVLRPHPFYSCHYHPRKFIPVSTNPFVCFGKEKIQQRACITYPRAHTLSLVRDLCMRTYPPPVVACALDNSDAFLFSFGTR